MTRTVSALAVLTLCWSAEPASAFCGFYVTKADAKLFNKASRVVMVRDGDRTVMTMANDYRGDPKEFAIVIPVPTFLEREQIHVTNNALIDHLDTYTAPRLVEYYDPDPCAPRILAMPAPAAPGGVAGGTGGGLARRLGVRIEAQYTVGEYDILILSANESNGLIEWLRANRYRIPNGAADIVSSYLRQGMRFFVARVNLNEQARLGFSYLRPLQVAYESPKFMLPIRLGTVNADGPQELFVYALTRRGRVETTNYRTVKLPTGVEIPTYIRDEFAPFYRAMFAEQVKRENMRTVFLEYAWDMGWCDPCAADPLTRDELRELGVFWLEDESGRPTPIPLPPQPRIAPRPLNVFVTRLHVRYDAAGFPEDLAFQETLDRQNFQGRYVLRHPFTGEATCAAAEDYRRGLRERREREAQMLASLTGLSVDDIRKKMPQGSAPESDAKWWQRLWKKRESGGPDLWRYLSRWFQDPTAKDQASPRLAQPPESLFVDSAGVLL